MDAKNRRLVGRAVLADLLPVVAVTAIGWAVLAWVAWRAHGDRWWQVVQLASVVWLFWTVRSLRALEGVLDQWRAQAVAHAVLGWLITLGVLALSVAYDLGWVAAYVMVVALFLRGGP